MNFRSIASGIMMSKPRATCSIAAVSASIFPEAHAVGCEQQHFAIVRHARKPCTDSEWIKVDVNRFLGPNFASVRAAKDGPFPSSPTMPLFGLFDYIA